MTIDSVAGHVAGRGLLLPDGVCNPVRNIYCQRSADICCRTGFATPSETFTALPDGFATPVAGRGCCRTGFATKISLTGSGRRRRVCNPCCRTGFATPSETFTVRDRQILGIVAGRGSVAGRGLQPRPKHYRREK